MINIFFFSLSVLTTFLPILPQSSSPASLHVFSFLLGEEPAQFVGRSVLSSPLIHKELKRAEPKQHEMGVRLVKTMKRNE